MVEILAAAGEAVGSGGSAGGLIGYVATGAGGAVLTIAGLIIKRGFSVRVGDEKGPPAASPAGFPCVLHEQFEKNLDERHHAVLSGINRVEGSVTRLHERFDTLVQEKRAGKDF